MARGSSRPELQLCRGLAWLLVVLPGSSAALGFLGRSGSPDGVQAAGGDCVQAAAGDCVHKHIGGRERLADVAQPWFGVPTSALRRPRAAGGWYKSELTRGTRHLRGLASESPRGFPLEREAIGDLRSHLY